MNDDVSRGEARPDVRPSPPANRDFAQRLISALTSSWKLAAVLGVIAGICLFALLGLLRAAVPPTTSYITRIQLGFPGVAIGRYPNGDTFALNMIIDPVYLGAAYEKLRIADYGIKREDFIAGFSIRPYVAAESEVADRYRQQLQDRRLTFSERERLEVQLRNYIEQLSRTSAEISFTERARFGIPAEIGRAAVELVPQLWAQTAIEQIGVLRLPGYSASQVIVPERIGQVSVPQAILELMESFQRVTRRIRELSEVQVPVSLAMAERREKQVRTVASSGGITTARDPVSGKSLRDIERDIRDFELYRFFSLRQSVAQNDFGEDGTRALSSLAQRVDDLRRDEADAERNASVVGDTITRFVQAIVTMKGRAIESRPSGSGESAPPVVGSVTIPQLSENFIDRIVELASKSGGVSQLDYVVDLTSRYMSFKEQAVVARSDTEKFNGLLAQWRTEQPKMRPISDETRGRLKQDMVDAAQIINDHWAALTRLENEHARNWLNLSGRLYTPFAVQRDIIVTDPIINERVIVMAVCFAILLFFALWGLRSMLHLIKHNRD